MAPLRQRMLDDMRLRNFSAETQRSYIHDVAGFASYLQRSPGLLGLDEIRLYRLYLLDERKRSPQSANCFVAAAKFLYTVTLEMTPPCVSMGPRRARKAIRATGVASSSNWVSPMARFQSA